MEKEKKSKPSATITKKSNTTSKKKVYTTKPSAISATDIQIMKSSLSVSDTAFRGFYEFNCGWKVPVYEVETVHALNQLIGYAKFNNRSYGDVYYRGERRLHKSLMPSIFREGTNSSRLQHLKEIISKIKNDVNFPRGMKIEDFDDTSASLTIESMLQHYGVKTRFIDIVDNHWVALWMGLNQVEELKQVDVYYHYRERSIPLGDIVLKDNFDPESIYQYILLIAVPGKMKRINNGIFFSSDYYKIDLRQALPSIFLRPHAQHGLVVCKRPHEGDLSLYDMANSVIGIIKIRIDRAAQWIGQGHLLTQDNLFPAPAYDYGYDLLLHNPSFFDKDNKIALYV